MELDKAISIGLEMGADFIDIREQEILTTSIEIVDGTVRTLSTGKKVGYGIRSFIKGAWGFSVTHDKDKEFLRRAIKDSVRLAKISAPIKKERFDLKGISYEGKASTSRIDDPSEIPVEEKLNTALSLGKSARLDERIKNITVRYNDVIFFRKSNEQFWNQNRTRDFPR